MNSPSFVPSKQSDACMKVEDQLQHKAGSMSYLEKSHAVHTDMSSVSQLEGLEQ